MSILAFLSGAKVEEALDTKTGRGGARKAWNPKPLKNAVRLWHDGSVFPSQSLVDKFDLEYKKATVTKEEVPVPEPAIASFDTTEAYNKAHAAWKKAPNKIKRFYEFPEGTGNGFDVIVSSKWSQFKSQGGSLLFLSPALKSAAKVDLFAAVKYNDEGNPISSVMSQGSPFPDLVKWVKEIYGIELDKEKKPYIDLMVFTEVGEPGDEGYIDMSKYSVAKGILPKTVARGAEKGQDDFVRRDNVVIFGFVPEELLKDEVELDEDDSEESTGVEQLSADEALEA
jgi:hypothetical protein